MFALEKECGKQQQLDEDLEFSHSSAVPTFSLEIRLYLTGSELKRCSTLQQATERMSADQRISGVEQSVPGVVAPVTNGHEAPSSAGQQEPERPSREEVAEALLLASTNNKSGSMRKKLTGKTYHHIKDIFTTKFSNKTSKSKMTTPTRAENGTTAATTTAAVASSTNVAAGETIIPPNGKTPHFVMMK